MGHIYNLAIAVGADHGEKQAPDDRRAKRREDAIGECRDECDQAQGDCIVDEQSPEVPGLKDPHAASDPIAVLSRRQKRADRQINP